MRYSLALIFALSPLAPAQELSSNPQEPGWSTDWIDYDRDGLVDSLLLDAQGPTRLLRNLGTGEFQDVTRQVGLDQAGGATRAFWKDYDRDGRLDLLLIRPARQAELFRANELGGFDAVGAEAGLDLFRRIDDARWFDFDDDGEEDLLLMSPSEHRLYRNEGLGSFAQVRVPLAPERPTLEGGSSTDTEAKADQVEALPEPRENPAASAPPSGTTGLAGGTSTRAPGGRQPASVTPTCALGVDDFANPGSCIVGSTSPTLGMLYPLSNDWFIDGLGSVGLGTTSPTARLDVDGLIRSRSGGIEFPDGSVQTTATLMGPAGTDALWQVDGNHMHHATGRVGIGNDDPQVRLHVSGDTTVDRGDGTSGVSRTLQIGGARSSSVNPYVTIALRNYDDDGDQTDYTGARIRAYNDTGEDTGSIAFDTHDGSSLDEAMRIASSGNVGIGNDDPQDPLHVSGDVRVDSGKLQVHRGTETSASTGVLNIGGARNIAGNAFATINFDNYDSDGNQADYTGARIQSFNETSADSGNLKFTVNDGSSLFEAMRIEPDGKVGIGTNNPAEQLDVNGTIRSRSGGFEFPDGSVQSTAVFEGTQHTSVGPGSFVSQSGNAVIKNNAFDGVWVDATGGAAVIAGVDLPDGAKVTGYTVYVNDLDTEDIEVQFARKRHANPDSSVFGGTFTVQASTGYANATNTFTHNVNNENGAYFFFITPASGSWPASSDLAIQNIVVHWTME